MSKGYDMLIHLWDWKVEIQTFCYNYDDFVMISTLYIINTTLKSQNYDLEWLFMS